MSKSDYILRNFLDEQLKKATEEAAKRIVPPGENHAYELGRALGYTDGLKAARALLWDLPESEDPHAKRILGKFPPFG